MKRTETVKDETNEQSWNEIRYIITGEISSELLKPFARPEGLDVGGRWSPNLNDPASWNKRNIRTRDTSRRNGGSVPFPLFFSSPRNPADTGIVLGERFIVAVSGGPLHGY